MSAYVLSHENFNKIYSYLYSARDNKTAPMAAARHCMVYEELDAEEFTQELYALNIYSVMRRYPSDSGEHPELKLRTGWPVGNVEMAGILHSLAYQSCEGNADKTRAYGILKKLSAAIDREIVSNLPNYQWGA